METDGRQRIQRDSSSQHNSQQSQDISSLNTVPLLWAITTTNHNAPNFHLDNSLDFFYILSVYVREEIGRDV